MTVILGITGSFGSGKSTVASMFGDLGVPVMDADTAARDAVVVGSPGLAQIVEAFGEDVLAADKGLDRKKMAAIVFDDPESRGVLNAIVHPRVGLAMTTFIQEHSADPLVALEVPLLLEGRTRLMVDKVLVVTTTEEARIERLSGSGYSKEEIAARLSAQMPQEEKVQLADFVVANDGDLDRTRSQVGEIARQMGVSGAGIDGQLCSPQSMPDRKSK